MYCCTTLYYCPLVVVITGWHGRSLSPSPFLLYCSKQTKKRKFPPLRKIRGNMFICTFLCFSLCALVHVIAPSPVPSPYTYAWIWVCIQIRVCLCGCVFYVCNARRQLNLPPLITGIEQPQKKTHPISCDMTVTSCGPVFMDAVPACLLISWFVCACEIEFRGLLVALLPRHWQVDYPDRAEIVSASL